MDTTPLFRPAPCAMLVGVSDDEAARCASGLVPLNVLRVRHAAAACERMLTTHPFVVVLAVGVHEQDADAICAVARDVRAQVVKLGDLAEPDLAPTLKEARREAERQRGERSG